MPFPNNPTGSIMTREDLQDIVDVVLEKDLFVISDEIYSELTYGSNHVSIAEFPGMKERTVVINGFSKSYAMTGWRLGYAAGPENIITQMIKIFSNVHRGSIKQLHRLSESIYMNYREREGYVENSNRYG